MYVKDVISDHCEENALGIMPSEMEGERWITLDR